jgi:hypothetical protein
LSVKEVKTRQEAKQNKRQNKTRKKIIRGKTKDIQNTRKKESRHGWQERAIKNNARETADAKPREAKPS